MKVTISVSSTKIVRVLRQHHLRLSRRAKELMAQVQEVRVTVGDTVLSTNDARALAQMESYARACRARCALLRGFMSAYAQPRGVQTTHELPVGFYAKLCASEDLETVTVDTQLLLKKTASDETRVN